MSEIKYAKKKKRAQAHLRCYLQNVFRNCSDTGKLICLICMSVRKSLYTSLIENNWESWLTTN